MSEPIKTVSTEGIFAGQMHALSMGWALAGPWKFLSWTTGTRVTATCEICGQGLANRVAIVNAAGRYATIGFDCAHTLIGNQADKQELKRLKAAQSDHERKLRQERKRKAEDAKARRIGKCAALLMSEPLASRYKAQPHPHEYWAGKGKTMFDYLGFCLRGGAVGALRVIEQDAA